MDIKTSTILITGGGSGIGQGLAEAFHARGARVIITGRREAALKAVAETNPGMAWATLDIDDPAAIKTFAAQVTRDHPGLNAVIHNAGIMRTEDIAADDFETDTAEAIVTTNLLGPIRLTSALIGHLKAQPKATIMTVTSGLAFIPWIGAPTYNATKAAIHSWTQSLRTQLASTAIEVLELAPPGVATELMPGHAENPATMPLADYITEVVGLIERGETPRGEILVENVKPMRFAEIDGHYEEVYSAMNGAH